MPSFEFDAAEHKLLKSMCDQTVKQFSNSKNQVNKQGLDVFSKIGNKLNSHKGSKINFNQQEHMILKKAMQESMVVMNKQLTEVWFGKRIIMKMMMKTYKKLLAKLNLVKK
jgi:S-adenosylmethionine synthetase